ncbi:MAG: hypothetical protein RBU21_14160 [FCB group bacterium]|jgi:predicted RNA-binding Zn-ribbon protein involved in translation (DUF1610 family)|nr:hypothetical protein [FCB group bacterium]
MKHLSCPHCGSNRIGANRIPKDVVVVLPCPACHELVVIFRNKTAAANREVLENGTKEQRKAHIAEIVMEFLDSLVFRSFPMNLGGESGESIEANKDGDFLDDAELEEEVESIAKGLSSEITQREIDRFVKTDLQRIDDSSYFRKYFS